MYDQLSKLMNIGDSSIPIHIDTLNIVYDCNLSAKKMLRLNMLGINFKLVNNDKSDDDIDFSSVNHQMDNLLKWFIEPSLLDDVNIVELVDYGVSKYNVLQLAFKITYHNGNIKSWHSPINNIKYDSYKGWYYTLKNGIGIYLGDYVIVHAYKHTVFRQMDYTGLDVYSECENTFKLYKYDIEPNQVSKFKKIYDSGNISLLIKVLEPYKIKPQNEVM